MTDNALRRNEREIARAAKGALDRLSAGSLGEVLIGMVGGRRLDQGTLQRLAARIALARDEKERER
jgi:hypothetical protein